MLEHHALPRLHAIDAAVEYARHQHVWRVYTGIVHAGIAMLAQPHLHIRGPGRADQDTKVGSEQNIGVAARRETRL